MKTLFQGGSILNNSKWKSSRKWLLISLFILFSTFLMAGCQNVVEESSSSAISSEVLIEYDSIEKTNGVYFFQKETSLSAEEMETFANLSEEALTKNITLFQIESPNLINFYLEERENLKISPTEIRIPTSLIKDQSVNYASVGCQALLTQSSSQLWYATGLAWSMGGEESLWQSPDIHVLDTPMIAQVLEEDSNGWLTALSSEAFDSQIPEFSLSASYSVSFVAYLKEKFGEEILLQALAVPEGMEEIFGKSIQALLDEWFTSLSILHGFENNRVFVPSVAMSGVQTSEMDRNIHVGTRLYAYQNTEMTDEQALVEVTSTERSYAYANEYINGAEASGDTSASFAMTANFIEQESSMFDWLQLTDGNNMVLAVQILIGDPMRPWIQQGLPAMLKWRMEEKNIEATATEILANEVNKSLPAMSRVVFEESQQKGQIELYRTLTGAFCEYLEITYGKESLLKIYADYLNFLGITGTTFDQARYAWMSDLNCPESTLVLYTPTAPPRTIEVIPPSGGAASVFIEKDGWYSYESDVCVYNFEKGYMDYDEMWDFVSRNDQAIKDIKVFLGEDHISYDGKLNYRVVSSRSGSMATDENIQLAFVKDQHAEYVHEDVHSIAGMYNPIWINEGFAVYVDQLLTTWHTTPAAGEDLHELSKQIIFYEDGESLLDFSDRNYTAALSSKGQKSRMRAYIIAASLVRYIDEVYGREVLLNVQEDFDRCEEILGVDFETLKTNWLNFLETEVD